MARIDDILASIMKGAQDAGAAIEQLTVGHEEKLAGMGGEIGSTVTGSVGAGAHLGQNMWRSDKEASAYLHGVKQAMDRYKVALLPLLGAIAAPTLGRMAVGRLAGSAIGRAGGGMVGRAAGGLNKVIKNPLGGAAFDMGTSMAAQSALS